MSAPETDKTRDPLTGAALQAHIDAALAAPGLGDTELALYYQILQRLFRPTLINEQNIPERPCLFVGNHSLFALDGWILVPTLQKLSGRKLRSMGDRFLWANPTIGASLLKRGAVIGHPEVCAALMENGADLLVFPGGAHEAIKPASANYKLQWKERYGFVRMAATHGYTIQPMGIVGPDEFYEHLIESEDLPGSFIGKLLQRIGLIDENTRSDMLPPIPRGALGTLLPRPQICYIGFGEPIDLSKYKGRKLNKAQLQHIRDAVAGQIEEQLSKLLILQKEQRQNDGLLRRLLTI
ncbi:MAG: lysophospholipid acyltransferase family protein [Parahaliea sp.]